MTNYRAKAIATQLTKARGRYYLTSLSPTMEDLIDMVKQADSAAANTYGKYNDSTILAIVRKMLSSNESAERVCSNPLSI